MAAAQKNRSIELLEESLQILRSGGPVPLIQHWTGSVPFAIALLLLLHDIGLSWGATLLLRDSLLCALAFVWMSYWKGRASRSILGLLTLGSSGPNTGFRRAALQTIFQTAKLLVLPFAAASILAWPMASLFFRTLAVEPYGEIPAQDHRPLRSGVRRAFATSAERYKENAVAYLAIAALAVVTCLNVLATLFLLPTLWKIFTGYETDWSRMQAATLWGVLTVAVITTWLLIDPWIQTYAILRVFYQNSKTDGRDLLRQIARVAATIILWSLLVPFTGTAAQAPNQIKLDRAIEQVSQRPDYGWLRPRQQADETGFMADVARSLNGGITWLGQIISSWRRSFEIWLRNLLNSNQGAVGKNTPPAPHANQLRWMLAVVAVLICGCMVALFIRTRQVKKTPAEPLPEPTPQADVHDETILPSDVAQDEWLRLASQYQSSGQTRLAARAFYLANLSYLGSRSFLSLSLSKSNRIYERELARQPKLNLLCPPFIAANRLYERAWYGMRELAADQMNSIRSAADEIRQHA